MDGTTFSLGAAHYGGAIYASDMDDFTMTTYDTRFANNQAKVNGGAIYLGGLDKYNVLVNKTYM
jgi:predicted outer membrane repeat protein